MDQLAELIEYVARALVDEPDEVQVELVDGDRALIVELTVAQSDLGKVIGKDGRIAYKGGRGPREFSVPEMQEELKKLIAKNK